MNMSPIKSSKKTGKPYSNLHLETADQKIVRAVCFSSVKRKLLDRAEQNQLGLHISNSTIGQDGTLKINDNSFIREENLGFKPTYRLPIHTIAEVINEIALDTHVNIEGVVITGDMDSVAVSGQQVKIKKGHICDTTGYVKLCLWREYTEVENGVSYIITNLRKTSFQNEVELQTTNTTSYRKLNKALINFIAPGEGSMELLTVEGKFAAAKLVNYTKCLFCETKIDCIKAVSYTHLTLPTIYSV